MSLVESLKTGYFGLRLRWIWYIGGIVLAGVLLGWLVANSRLDRRPLAPAAEPARGQARSNLVWSGPRQTPQPRPAVTVPQPHDSVSSDQVNTNSTWEDQVGELLVSDLEEPEKARQLLQLFPMLPEAGQEQIAVHLSFALSDEDYPLLAQYLTSPLTPEPVLDALLEGLLVRPDATQAPLLLVIATDEVHPKAAEARTLLESLLNQELSANPGDWPTAVQQWLQAMQP